MEKTYLTGNTVRLYASFFGNDGLPKDPTLIKIRFYDYRYNLLEEFLLSDNKIGVGEYFFDYRTPSEEMKVIYEWYGDIAGNPAIERSGFRTVFVKR